MPTDPDHLLVVVSSEADWFDCHRIRKAELHDARGRIGVYPSSRADDLEQDHFSLLLKVGGRSVATARLDVLRPGLAATRLVAVSKDEQSRGYGRLLQSLIEHFALSRNVTKLVVNAAPSAIGFYEKNGFAREVWDPAELVGPSADAVQMAKELRMGAKNFRAPR